MIVPRSFSPPADLNEKNLLASRGTRPKSRSPSRSTSQSRVAPTSHPVQKNTESRSDPVKIPSKIPRNAAPQSQVRPAPVAVPSAGARDRQTQVPRFRAGSAQSLLSATSIPSRRRKGRPSQRLPVDHVAGFSRLLLDDVPSAKDGSLPRNQSMSQLDGLFGNIDELVEGQVIVGSEGVDDGGLSARSISSDSVASLATPEDYGSSMMENHRMILGRSLQGKRTPRISSSEDCSGDHPLASLEDIETMSLDSLDSNATSTLSSPPRTTSPVPKQTKQNPSRSSFKSTLTSSLKALKSAARTTLSSSGFGQQPSSTSESDSYQSFLARNFFDIQPSLTDDRRPPPNMNPPSPELRRYLNPNMATMPADSPTQLHFWQDERYLFNTDQNTHRKQPRHKGRRKRSPTPKSKLDSLPSVVALSDCLPPAVRTANASSPPIWLTPDGEPVNKNTSAPLSAGPDTSSFNGISKTREPRENRDFLRIFVCEMEMRRRGKLNDDLSTGRAKLWLPPVADFQNNQSDAHLTRKEGAERWTVWTPDDQENVTSAADE